MRTRMRFEFGVAHLHPGSVRIEKWTRKRDVTRTHVTNPASFHRTWLRVFSVRCERKHFVSVCTMTDSCGRNAMR